MALNLVAVGVVAVAAHSTIVTVLAAETYPCQVTPLPGFFCGITNTEPVDDVAPVIVTVAVLQEPVVNAEPPIVEAVEVAEVMLMDAAVIFAVLVVLPSAENESAAAWLTVSVVEAVPFVTVIPSPP